MAAVFTGIDLVEIGRFVKISPAIRSRFFQRVFTSEELAYIEDSNQRAAGIFAAKEAVSKALGCGIGPIKWVDIEISHNPQKQPGLILHGPAEDHSNSLRINNWSISITHTKTMAAAVAVAISE